MLCEFEKYTTNLYNQVNYIKETLSKNKLSNFGTYKNLESKKNYIKKKENEQTLMSFMS